MANALKVVIVGCSGRMGQVLLECDFADADLVLHGALDRGNFDGFANPQLGHDAGEKLGKLSGIKVVDDIGLALKDADVLVDFTRPDATMSYLVACQQAKVNIVIGTTGFSNEQKIAISKASISVLYLRPI